MGWRGLFYRGEPGPERVLGGAGNDTIYGFNGDDTIDAGAGNNLIEGHQGNDLFLLYADFGFDTVKAGKGWDRIQIYSDGVSAMRVDKVGPGIIDLFLNGTRVAHITGVEMIDVVGGPRGDFIEGLVDNPDPTNGDNLSGGGGDDTIFAGFGDDFVEGEDGRDVLDGDAGDDTLAGGADDDRADGGLGRDLLSGGAGNDNLMGSYGIDTIDGGPGNDYVNGQRDDDLVRGGAGNDRVEGGTDGNDTLEGGPGNDEIIGGIGNDRLDGGSGADRLIGGDGNDRLIGGGQRDELRGGPGADRFVFTDYSGRGVDQVRGFTSEDRLELSRAGFPGSARDGDIDLAQGANPRPAGTGGWFLYDTDNGQLSWDRDGIATAYDPVVFAVLTYGNGAAPLRESQLTFLDL